MASLRWAFDQGFRAVEFDIRLSRDDVVVSHDETLQRVAAPWSEALVSQGLTREAYQRLLQTPLHELRYDELAVVDVGSFKSPEFARERVPRFAEVLHKFMIPDHDRLCFVELKGSDPRLVEQALAAVKFAGVGPTQLRWIAFSLELATSIKARAPEFLVYHILAVLPLPGAHKRLCAALDRALAAGLDGLDLPADAALVTEELVAHVHGKQTRAGCQAELAVWRWPLARETPYLFSTLAARGVDAFTSDLPPEMLEWRDAASRSADGATAQKRSNL